VTDHDVKNLLRSLRDEPALGGSFGDRAQKDVWASVAQQAGLSASVKDAAGTSAYTLADYLDYAAHETRAFLRPMAAAAGAAGLVLSGWVTTVSAGNSLPGDVLYPMKLAGERVQIRLAGTPKDRVRLHAAFAERRMQEAVEITAKDVPYRTDRMRTAVASMKGELDSAHGELAALQVSAPELVAEAAAVLARKTEALNVLLEQAPVSDASEAVLQEVAVARETVKQAETQTVSTLVETHEQYEQAVTSEELQRNFRREYQRTAVRFTTARSRAAVLREAVAALPAEEAGSYLAAANQAVTELLPLDKLLADAMNVMAAGGYRRAFDLLAQAGNILNGVEGELAAQEIQYTAGRMVEPERPVEAPPEEPTDVPETTEAP